MELAFLQVLRAFEQERVRYLVVGGLAVVLHGHPRYTSDLDVVLDFEKSNLERAVACLRELGLRPRVPVAIEDFADAALRESWRSEKNMMVFSLFHPTQLGSSVDLFVSSPFDFEACYERKLVVPLRGQHLTVLAIEDLLALKLQAGRVKDLDDAEHLRKIMEFNDGK